MGQHYNLAMKSTSHSDGGLCVDQTKLRKAIAGMTKRRACFMVQVMLRRTLRPAGRDANATLMAVS